MFDDAFGMTTMCAGSFRDSVVDEFGASIVTDVLEPILGEIDSLRSLNADFLRQAMQIDRLLDEARAIPFADAGCAQ